MNGLPSSMCLLALPLTFVCIWFGFGAKLNGDVLFFARVSSRFLHFGGSCVACQSIARFAATSDSRLRPSLLSLALLCVPGLAQRFFRRRHA